MASVQIGGVRGPLDVSYAAGAAQAASMAAHSRRSRRFRCGKSPLLRSSQPSPHPPQVARTRAPKGGS